MPGDSCRQAFLQLEESENRAQDATDVEKVAETGGLADQVSCECCDNADNAGERLHDAGSRKVVQQRRQVANSSLQDALDDRRRHTSVRATGEAAHNRSDLSEDVANNGDGTRGRCGSAASVANETLDETDNVREAAESTERVVVAREGGVKVRDTASDLSDDIEGATVAGVGQDVGGDRLDFSKDAVDRGGVENNTNVGEEGADDRKVQESAEQAGPASMVSSVLESPGIL